jgi:hypothetical protein
VYSVMYVGKLVFSLSLIFLVICFRRWRLAKKKEEREREKKSVDKKKNGEREKIRKKIFVYVYMDLFDMVVGTHGNKEKSLSRFKYT